MDRENEQLRQQKSPGSDSGATEPSQLTRREALLQLLRVGGIAAGAAGTGVWFSQRSQRPLAATAEQARKDHRIASEQQWPHLTVTQYATDTRGAQPGEPRALVQKALESLGGMSRFIAR